MMRLQKLKDRFDAGFLVFIKSRISDIVPKGCFFFFNLSYFVTEVLIMNAK